MTLEKCIAGVIFIGNIFLPVSQGVIACVNDSVDKFIIGNNDTGDTILPVALTPVDSLLSAL
jgi:hypothetical protein